MRSLVMRERTFAGPVPGKDQMASTFDANACNGSSLALMVAARGCNLWCGDGGCSACAAASRRVQRMFGAVHLEVMLIMRCVLHEFAKGTQGSSQQCLKTTHPFVSSQIVADGRRCNLE